ncbi:hypothetical protein BX616_010588 [Lobosporangium transversale]|uniref:Uncharacterized protein n=1 Tax=Lobosporangium transversale TaxID=64571 RepID=A0A1Y2GKQ6_9FUNG|nr:hypothetical protein BCR41DRAFT_423875 [Lobosporangium transversale]KAF9911461.1 hypothetical protein BX616_010588 [Lobosporangium transversale]ORZ10325.1 hypothetical protein BCR41DRAFT_423875 [Lobosporangium transversale]|eukprot:XP_021879232.1 hypothetical protein BCR41DRAFT_423875 [Lobosporangium transversale]
MTTTTSSLADMTSWLMAREPGYLVIQLLSPFGKPIEEYRERKGRRGFKVRKILMSLQGMGRRLKCIRRLLGFKLKELQSVRYRRLSKVPQDKVPFRLTSTVSGVDYHLTEIRNIVKSQQDVRAIWGREPGKIKTLGIDLGQACVVGTSALLPVAEGDPNVFHNLAVKQKVMYQPTLKFRRWLEDKQSAAPAGAYSISDLESRLPSLRGENASIERYLSELGSARRIL